MTPERDRDQIFDRLKAGDNRSAVISHPNIARYTPPREVNDGEGLASLFTEDGTYEDGFFGAHTGRPAIAMMLQCFHDTGRAYLWEFLDPLSDGSIGYARFRFSHASHCQKPQGAPSFSKG